VLQTGIGSGSGFLSLGSGLESDSKKLEIEHLWYMGGSGRDRTDDFQKNCRSGLDRINCLGSGLDSD